MDKLTKDFYNNNAELLIKKYNSVYPEYHNILESLFSKGSKVLDIGCGSGRDLRKLLDLGFDAYGIEPSLELIKYSLNSVKCKILSGSLPDDLPDKVKDIKWDGIIIIAVLQHLTDFELNKAVNIVRSLIADSGKLIISIPVSYCGIKKNRDDNKRLFIIRSVEYYNNLLKNYNFKVISNVISNDALSRRGVSWATLVATQC